MAKTVKRTTTVQTNTADPITTRRDGSRHRKMGASKTVVPKTMSASSAVEMLSAAPISSGVPDSGLIRSPAVLDQTQIPITTAFATSPARSNLDARAWTALAGHHPADGAHQFLGLLIGIGRTAVAADEAVTDVIVEQSEALWGTKTSDRELDQVFLRVPSNCSALAVTMERDTCFVNIVR